MPGRRIMKRWSCTARSPREDQALLLRRRLPLVPRAASPHGDNLAASHNASASHIYRHYTNILSGRRRVSTDKSHQIQLVRQKAGSHGQTTSKYNLSGNKKPLYRFSFLSDSAAGRVAAFFRDQRHHQMPGRSWRAGQAQRRWKARRP